MPTLGRLTTLVASVALVGLGCTGQVGSGPPGAPGGPAGGHNPGGGPPGPGNPGGANPGGGNPGGGNPGGGNPGAMGTPGTGVFYRLTRVEYNNTIRDLLGDRSAPATAFAHDQDSAKSGYFAGGAIANADAARLFEATEALAASAARRLPEILPCKALPTAAAEQTSCAQQWVTQFGKRAFRRPLTDEETKSFVELYNQQRMAGQDFPNAIRVVLSAFLLSPQFLYRWEVTPKSAVKEGILVRYNSYEVASRLSYLFWASMPDETGFALAEQNKLNTPDQIEAEARRMLKDPKARGAIADFFSQWLGITDLSSAPKDPKVFKDFTPELAASMLAETVAFATHGVLEGDGKLSTLLTSPSSFLDANLAKLYKVNGVTSPTPVANPVNAGERIGILGHASWLTAHGNSDETNPPRRGKVLADRVLCVELGLPPDDVPDPKPPAPNLSVRERFEELTTQPCALACHQVLDPLGFAFENYSGIGVYQTTDGGKPVNASGKLTLDMQSRPFKNAIELANHLAQSRQVATCMARQLVRYALRRKETAGDEASIAAAEAAFARSSYNLRELMVAFTRTGVFTHRTPSMGEVLR